MDGPEMISTNPASANGICHQLSPMNPVTTDASAVPNASQSQTDGRKIPANLAISKGGRRGFAGLYLCRCVGYPAALASTAFSRAPANFSICSPIMRAMRL